MQPTAGIAVARSPPRAGATSGMSPLSRLGRPAARPPVGRQAGRRSGSRPGRITRRGASPRTSSPRTSSASSRASNRRARAGRATGRSSGPRACSHSSGTCSSASAPCSRWWPASARTPCTTSSRATSHRSRSAGCPAAPSTDPSTSSCWARRNARASAASSATRPTRARPTRDNLLLVHLDPTHTHATVLSIPRDMFVYAGLQGALVRRHRHLARPATRRAPSSTARSTSAAPPARSRPWRP